MAAARQGRSSSRTMSSPVRAVARQCTLPQVVAVAVLAGADVVLAVHGDRPAGALAAVAAVRRRARRCPAAAAPAGTTSSGAVSLPAAVR